MNHTSKLKINIEYGKSRSVVKMDDSTNSETDWSKFRTGRNSPSIVLKGSPPDAEVYQKHDKRGMAIIFNHKYFESNHCKPRYGTEKDRDDLNELLKELKFEVKIYEDLKYHQILNVLNEASKKDHTDHECLLLVVMSHGEEGILYAKDHHYPTKKLWNSFSPLHCPSLAGKPKFFFIQSCRGHMTDPGVQLSYNDQTDGPKDEETKVYTIPVTADFLIMYATVEGYYAWRDPVTGSCFVQALVNQLRKHHKTKELLSILTRVNREVAIEFSSREPRLEEFDQKKEMCSIVSMLTRDFYFN